MNTQPESMKPLARPQLILIAALSVLAIIPQFSAFAASPLAKSDSIPVERLRAFSSYLKQMKSFSVEAENVMQNDMPGLQQKMTVRSLIALERPSKFALRFSGGFPGLGMTIVTDGKTLDIFNPATNSHTTESAPEGLEAALAVITSPVLAMIEPLASQDLYALITKDVQEVSVVGTEVFEGVTCTVVRLIETKSQTALWIEVGEQPLLRKLEVHSKPSDAEVPDSTFFLSMTLRNWKVDPLLPEETFVFNPPEGSKPAKSGEKPDSRGHAMLGQPAPELSIELLTGGKIDLAAHKGKEIVVLEFWATWCPPCVRALPQMVETLEPYHEKGVRFFAVNQRENAQTIRRFLERTKLSIPVASDPEGQAGDLFKVEAIPHTVLIGKDGLIQAVHVGLLPDLKTRMRSEIDTLLAGGSLLKASP
jgi:peroxiredoxin